jgi:hypothetical protein
MRRGNAHLVNASDKYKDNQSKTMVSGFFFFNIVATKTSFILSFLTTRPAIAGSADNDFHPVSKKSG